MNNNQPELSALEVEILQLLAVGNRTSEIAKRLGLDFKSVAEMSKAIKTKLRAETVTDLVTLAQIYTTWK